MTQIKTKIPAELEPAAVGGMVTDAKYIKDRVKNKTQVEVNADTEERVSTLEEKSLFKTEQTLTTAEKDQVAQNLNNRGTANGMGRIELKVTDNFKTVVEAQTNGNTIFVIKYDFTLTDNVTIPANCVLEFDGGSINAGSGSNMDTITLNDSLIKANVYKIFDINLTIIGLKECNVKWFGAIGDGVTDDTAVFQKVATFNNCKIYIPKGIYSISNTINASTSISEWIGEFCPPASNHFAGGTTLLYTGNEDITFVYLPYKCSNIHFKTSKTIGQDTSTFIGNGISLSYPSSFVNDRVFDNITVSGFKNGLMLESNFGCKFNNININNNHIGINLNCEYTQGVSSGFIPLINFTNFRIAGNGLYAIARLQDAPLLVRLFFNYGYIESNGHNGNNENPISIYTPLGTGCSIGVICFTDTYGEGPEALCSVNNGAIDFINCSFTESTYALNRFGSLSFVNTAAPKVVIDGGAGIATVNIFNSQVKSLGPGIQINKGASVSKAAIGITGDETGLVSMDAIPSTSIEGINVFKVSGRPFFYDTLTNGIIFKNTPLNGWANIAAANSRPTLDNNMQGYLRGFVFLNKTRNKIEIWDNVNKVWLDTDGAFADWKRSGTFAEKPVSNYIYIGFRYFCTDKPSAPGSPIYYTGDSNTPWVYADGTAVS